MSPIIRHPRKQGVPQNYQRNHRGTTATYQHPLVFADSGRGSLRSWLPAAVSRPSGSRARTRSRSTRSYRTRRSISAITTGPTTSSLWTRSARTPLLSFGKPCAARTWSPLGRLSGMESGFGQQQRGSPAKWLRIGGSKPPHLSTANRSKLPHKAVANCDGRLQRTGNTGAHLEDRHHGFGRNRRLLRRTIAARRG